MQDMNFQCAGLSSDHYPVIFELLDRVDLAVIPHQVTKDYASADWRGFASMIGDSLAGIDLRSIDSEAEAERVIAVLTDGIQAADRACIPRKRRQFSTFGLSDEMLALIGERRAAIRRWQQFADGSDHAILRHANG